MGKYASNLVTMLKDPNIPDLLPGRSHVFVFGQECFKDSPIYMELYTITGNNMQFQGIPKGAPKIITYKTTAGVADGHVGGPYPKWNRNCDEMFFFYGTDPNNINDLGAHVEFHLGEGEDKDIFEFDEPRCVFVPKDVKYGPIYVNKFRRNFIEFVLLTAPSRVATGTVSDLDYVADVKKIEEMGLMDVMEKYRTVHSDVKGLTQ